MSKWSSWKTWQKTLVAIGVGLVLVVGVLVIAVGRYLQSDGDIVDEGDVPPALSNALLTGQPGYRESLYDTVWPADMANHPALVPVGSIAGSKWTSGSSSRRALPDEESSA